MEHDLAGGGLTVELTWHAFDLASGRRGPEVIVQASPPVGRIIGEPTDASFSILCYDHEADEPVPGWEAATEPGRSMLVALDGDEEPVWAGMVLRRRSSASQWVQVDCATLEAYFDRRYVDDHGWVQTDQAVIATGLIGDAINLGINFIVDAPPSGRNRDRTYVGDEDKTVLSVLQDLMGVNNGPEFTVDLEWADEDKTVLNRVVRVRDRIGRASPLPVAAFHLPGSVVDFQYVESYTTDEGANDVMAVSSGEGELRPESAHFVAHDLLDAGWPVYEHRFTPSTSITRQSRLDSHARRELAEMRDGLRELSLEAHLSTAPRLGVDFHLGDDVDVQLTCPRFPDGLTATMRCIGWEIDVDADRIKPRLVMVD